ncbi:MAG: hypothetical protein M3179_14450 [Actinomycetota bacterium]|nr:hypothetical protein [Actinomycetota bacterium]
MGDVVDLQVTAAVTTGDTTAPSRSSMTMPVRSGTVRRARPTLRARPPLSSTARTVASQMT